MALALWKFRQTEVLGVFSEEKNERLSYIMFEFSQDKLIFK